MLENNGNKIIEVFNDSYDDSVDYIAMNLRSQDFDEAFALTGENPYDTVKDSWLMSSRRWIVLNKDN